MSGTSSIKVRDERTGTVHLVGFHYISFASVLNINGMMIMILFLLPLLHKLVYWNGTANTYTKVSKNYGNRIWK